MQTNFRQAARPDHGMLHRFVAACIERGMYFHASPHHGFSAAHSDLDIETALEAVEGALTQITRTHPTA